MSELLVLKVDHKKTPSWEKYEVDLQKKNTAFTVTNYSGHLKKFVSKYVSFHFVHQSSKKQGLSVFFTFNNFASNGRYSLPNANFIHTA